MANPVETVIRPIDRWQQRHGPVAFVFAVVKKFGDDRGGTLCALITFYGFLSLFPLLLLGFTVLSFVARPGSQTYNDIRTSALNHFPVVGNLLPNNGLNKSGLGLVVGAVGLLWGALGVAQAVQFAVNEVWGVPNRERPPFLARLARGLMFFGLLGVFVVLSQALTALGSIVTGSAAAGVAGIVASLILSVGLFLCVFKVVGPARLAWKDHLPGAVFAAAGWQALQVVAQRLVQHDVRNMTPLYGQFAVVLGLISFLSIAAQITIYALELNTVLKRHLWPRSIVQPPLTEADRRALEERALEEERRTEQHITVTWDPVQDRSHR
jgi:YihY family inner membrane protein